MNNEYKLKVTRDFYDTLVDDGVTNTAIYGFVDGRLATLSDLVAAEEKAANKRLRKRADATIAVSEMRKCGARINGMHGFPCILDCHSDPLHRDMNGLVWEEGKVQELAPGAPVTPVLFGEAAAALKCSGKCSGNCPDLHGRHREECPLFGGARIAPGPTG